LEKPRGRKISKECSIVRNSCKKTKQAEKTFTYRQRIRGKICVDDSRLSTHVPKEKVYIQIRAGQVLCSRRWVFFPMGTEAPPAKGNRDLKKSNVGQGDSGVASVTGAASDVIELEGVEELKDELTRGWRRRWKDQGEIGSRPERDRVFNKYVGEMGTQVRNNSAAWGVEGG